MQTTMALDRRPVTLVTRDGREVEVRPIQPDDADLLVDLFWQLSPETRWRRFFVPLDHVSPALVEQTAKRLAAIDPRREEALVAVTSERRHAAIVAVARLASFHVGEDTAEGSVVVRDDYHGVGLGTQLFELLVQAAMARGLRKLVLLTQSDNTATITMIKHLGLPYTCSFADGLCELTLHL